MGLNDCLYPNKHRWNWGFSHKRCHKFDWYGEEPVYHASGDWNCGAFWETYQYHWHVDSCVQRNYYVCEMAQVWIFYIYIYRQIEMGKFCFFILPKRYQYSHNIYNSYNYILNFLMFCHILSILLYSFSNFKKKYITSHIFQYYIL